MSYKASKRKIEPRSPELLIRTDDIYGRYPYNLRAPGLYPDETLYEIAGAGLVAVSVETRRQENGGGLAITAWARAIEADGSTRLDDLGTEMETSLSATFDWGAVKLRGQKVLEREVLLAVMGEDGEMLPADPELDLPERPIIHVDRASASIVQAVKAATGSPDPAALLKA